MSIADILYEAETALDTYMADELRAAPDYLGSDLDAELADVRRRIRELRQRLDRPPVALVTRQRRGSNTQPNA